MKSISVKEFTDFLNQRTGGFSCSICQHEDWCVQSANGMVGSVDLANHVVSLEDIDAITEHKPLPEKKQRRSNDGRQHDHDQVQSLRSPCVFRQDVCGGADPWMKKSRKNGFF